MGKTSLYNKEKHLLVCPADNKPETLCAMQAQSSPLSLSSPIFSLSTIPNLDKQHLKTLASGLDVDLDELVLPTLPVGTSQEAAYREVAAVCAAICSSPDWSVLGARVLLEWLGLQNPLSYSTFTKTGQGEKGFQTDYVEFVQQHAAELNELADLPEPDFDYPAVASMIKSYLTKVSTPSGIMLERPRYMMLRVAVFLHQPHMPSIAKLYQILCDKRATVASPAYFNAACRRPNLSSCFVGMISDDMLAISEHWREAAFISMNAGGLGSDYSYLRHSEVGVSGGWSKGIIPWLRIHNEIMDSVDQGGKRNGSCTAHLRDWHIDVREFIELRRPNGAENMRTRSLFLSLVVSDLFWERVLANERWSLFCPNKCPGLTRSYGSEFRGLYNRYEQEGRAAATISAQELYINIYHSRIETGMPFIINHDNINRKNMQDNIGPVTQSNLCVSPDTLILTKQGHIPIKELENKTVQVWNGEEWSETTVYKTGTGKDLLRVQLSNGVHVDCTPEHRFPIYSGKKDKHDMKHAKELKQGDRLINFDLPSHIQYDEAVEFKYPYTHGFFCGDGTYDWNKARTECKPKLYLYAAKKELLQYMTTDGDRVYENTKSDRYTVYIPRDIAPKFQVPLRASLQDRLRWLEGYCDADGVVVRNGGAEGIQVTSVEREFLVEIRYMLQTLGVEAKVQWRQDGGLYDMPDGKGGKKQYLCKTAYRMCIGGRDVQHLVSLGFSPKRLQLSDTQERRVHKRYTRVVSVEQGPVNQDTFCFTEPKRGMGVFNSTLLSNCQEITLHTSPQEISSCVLASIVLANHVTDTIEGPVFDWELLQDTVRTMVRALNAVVDRTYYPPEIPKIKYAALKNRPIGLGVQGLADTFARLNLSWLDEEAHKCNYQIAECIYYTAVQEGCELAKVYGPYPAFEGSHWSRGVLHPDLADIEGRCPSHPEWSRYSADTVEMIRHDIRQHGSRNSVYAARMPTASTSVLMGMTECFEPFAHLIYTRKLLSGKFILVNRWLYKDLKARGLWSNELVKRIISAGGSVQSLNLPAEIKSKYQTAFELKPSLLQQYTNSVTRFVDQSSSINGFFSTPTFNTVLNWDIDAWKNGAKTGMYYLRTLPRDSSINFALKSSRDRTSPKQQRGEQVETVAPLYCTKDEGCTSCQG